MATEMHMTAPLLPLNVASIIPSLLTDEEINSARSILNIVIFLLMSPLGSLHLQRHPIYIYIKQFKSQGFLIILDFLKICVKTNRYELEPMGTKVDDLSSYHAK